MAVVVVIVVPDLFVIVTEVGRKGNEEYEDETLTEHGILSRAAEFAHFHGISIFYGILRNPVLAGNIGDKYGIF